MARRTFVGLCAGAGWVALGRALGMAQAVPLRPPGGLEEARFSGLCIRCGSCAAACPARIIHPDPGGHGLASWLTPLLRFEEDYCREDCHRCGQVCPSGAITRLSLAAKQKRIIGLASVDLTQCLLAAGRECNVCIRRCPFGAVSLHTSDGGFSTSPQIDVGRCNGCGACEAACPTRPVRAIRVGVLSGK